MKSYLYPSILFRKEWHWFEEPKDILGADILNFFSYQDVSILGFKKKAGETTVIDLGRTEQELWDGMRKRFVRDQIKKGEKNGVTVSVGILPGELVPLYKEFREQKHIAKDDPKIFEYCLCVGAYHMGKIISGGVFIEDGTHMRALVLASARFSDDGRMREIVGQANRMLIWNVILFGKRQGFSMVDLGGISSQSADMEERSLAEFKEAFGGERRMGYYYTKVNSPILKLWLKLRRFLKI